MPLVVVVSEYYYGGELRRVPFVVGNELVRQLLKNDATKANLPVELYNTTILGPIPLVTGQVGIFTAFFRVQQNDYAELLLDILGQMGQTFIGMQALAALPMASALYDGVGRLLGMQAEEPRFGSRDELRADAQNQLQRSGYLVYSAADERELRSDQLWMRGGRLHVADGQSVHQYTQRDFCVLAVERRSSRGNYVDLACETVWREIESLLLDGKIDQAQIERLRLLKAIRQSPDLTRADMVAAQLAYTRRFEEVLEEVRANLPQGVNTRGSTTAEVTVHVLTEASDNARALGQTLRAETLQIMAEFMLPAGDRQAASTLHAAHRSDLIQPSDRTATLVGSLIDDLEHRGVAGALQQQHSADNLDPDAVGAMLQEAVVAGLRA